MSTTFILSNNTPTTNFTTNLSPPIHLDSNKEYEAALLSINLFNSIPNITEKNNVFRYSINNGQTISRINLNTGSYELQAINDEIQRIMIERGHFNTATNEAYISISPHISELKSIVYISNETYYVDFSVGNSIGPVLGFVNGIIRHGYNKSPNIVDITKVNSVLVNVDIINGSYVNGYESPAIYSFDPNRVSPGYKIDEKPNPSLIYYPVSRKDIYEIRVWLTDQDHNPIDLRGEKITVKIQIREVRNIEKYIENAIKKYFPLL